MFLTAVEPTTSLLLRPVSGPRFPGSEMIKVFSPASVAYPGAYLVLDVLAKYLCGEENLPSLLRFGSLVALIFYCLLLVLILRCWTRPTLCDAGPGYLKSLT